MLDRRHPILCGLALAAAAWADCTPAQAQSLLGALSVNSPGSVSIDIQQTGTARLGTAGEPVIVNSTGSGLVSLQVTQVGSSATASVVQAYLAGGSTSRIRLEQQTADHQAVVNTWARVLLGTATEPAGSGHDLTLLQQGNGATATLEAPAGDRLSAYLVQSAASQLGITSFGSDNVFGSAGAPFTLAAGSTVNITNQGNSNTFRIATQASGDSLSLHVKGDANIFNFDFPLAGGNAYRALSWGLAATPVEVNGGRFEAARFGDPGSYFYAVYDTTGVNAAQAATAVVTPR